MDKITDQIIVSSKLSSKPKPVYMPPIGVGTTGIGTTSVGIGTTTK